MLNICSKFTHLFKNAYKRGHKARLLQGLTLFSCPLCQAPIAAQQALCPACQQALPWREQQYCVQCGSLCFAQRCGECLQHPPHFDLTIAAFDYRYPLDKMIARYKYQYQLHLARPLAQGLLHSLAQQIAVFPDMLIAMPLHEKRLQQRGFNQSQLIAQSISQPFQLSISPACRRVINTPPQAGLDHQQRIRNIRGAFACDISLRGKRIAIVDDVMTTGASLNELARQLKKSGAAHVQCWVVARTQQNH
jgi:ComF family protein